MAFFVSRDPEYTKIVSDDGVVTIEGLVRESQDVQIHSLGNYLYDIYPADSVFTQPLSVTFDVSQADFTFDIAVYKYNPDVLMWEAVSAAYVPGVQQITIAQSSFGRYMIKESVDIESPDFISSYNSLLTMAPADTVGFEVAVGFITADGSIIRLPEKTQIGGCGGMFAQGNRTEMSQQEQSVRVYVNDVAETVQFFFVARWDVLDDIGCVDNVRLEVSTEL